MKQKREEEIKREQERQLEEDRLKEKMMTKMAKTKKKGWFGKSFETLKGKFTKKPKEEEVVPEEVEEEEYEEFIVFDGNGDPTPEVD